MSSSLLLPALEVETGHTPDATVIWLHGLGADGHDFEPVIPEFKLPETLALRFIFPHAPARPVTLSGGYIMRAWYDIYEATLRRRVDTHQLRESVRAVELLIDREMQRGIPAERIIIAGFSQGGAVALELALRCSLPLGGLIALSTYLAIEESVKAPLIRRSLPIFLAHGDQDDIVSPVLGDETDNLLRQAGFTPDYHRYPMGHSVCELECQDIGHWLKHQLQPSLHDATA